MDDVVRDPAIEGRQDEAELVLRNARVVTPDGIVAGTLAVRDGRIDDVAGIKTATRGAEDMDGDYLLPGLVDLHTDNLERHVVPRLGVRWNTMSAALAHDAQIAAAGIVTVLDSLCVGVSIKNPERNELLRPMIDGLAAAGQHGLLRADHLLHLRCETTDETVVPLFESLANEPGLRLISVMDHAPGHRQSPDVARYRERMKRYLNLSDDAVDAQIERLMAASSTVANDNRRTLALLGRSRGLPVASHDDDCREHVEEAARLGVAIAEFPTTFEAARRARELGLAILMGGPNLVRGVSHSGNVTAGELLDEGLVDILSSDYIPSSMVEAAFRLTDAPYDMPLSAAVALVAANPARAVGLTDRGTIAAGLRADLIRVRLVNGLPVVRAAWRAGRRTV